MDDAEDVLFRANEEEEEHFHEEFPDRKDLVVYLVDSGEVMFEDAPQEVKEEAEEVEEREEAGPEEGGKRKVSCFEEVIKCIEEDLKTRIIGRDYDDVALVLFNTREKKNPMSSEGVYVVQDLKQTSAAFIKQVRELPQTFDSEIGSRDPASAQNARDSPLWAAQSLFTVLGPSQRNCEKRILLFTNADDPFADAPSPGVKADLSRTCIQRAKDAQSLHINIELFPLSRPGRTFDVNRFYKEIISTDGEDASEFMETAKGRFEDLKSAMRKRAVRKRMIRRFFLTLPEREPDEASPKVALRGYALLRPSKITRAVLVNAADNAPIKMVTAHICEDTGAVLQSREAKKSLVVGSGDLCCRVVLDSKDLKAMKPFPHSSLQLLGFKPRSALKDYHNLRPSTFLYPEEQAASGSIPAFIALHKAMVELDRFAVAVASEMGAPRLVALLPQEEVVDSEQGQVLPPGWNMVYLPYQEDIRDLREVTKIKGAGGGEGEGAPGAPAVATAEQVERAALLIRKLNLKNFTCLDIQNPVVQSHYAMLEAVALDEEELPTFVDSSKPNTAYLRRPAVVDAVKAFKDAVCGEDWEAQEAAREAGAREKAEAAQHKRKALEGAAMARAGDIDWKGLASKGKLSKLTVEDLKTYLRANSLPLSGKKGDLVERVLSHLES